MAGLIVLKPGVDWTATGGLFDWTLEFLISRLSDRQAAARLQEIVDNNLGSLWIDELPGPVQQEIVRHWRSGLVGAGEQQLPETEQKATVVRHLQELVDATYTAEFPGLAEPT
ncbi:hypothetical protein C1I95_13750 [Micromonospora craterilacus]|uniref:Uncharacterized protein n=1 Tax=Micromonospora craterilacus TaxID=1655439 RepID=A0A2W2E306_9ACTN|nr:hypothetical protein [Micromonospora craterilacus]PZG18362.1 hypothetical protein C1I95_13750 [Micromonospora craterilacus]